MRKFLVLIVLHLFVMHGFGQDLIFQSYTGATTFSQYQPFSEKFVFKNNGIVDIEDAWVYCHAYLSTNATLSSNADLIGSSDLIENLAVGASVEVTIDRNEVDVVPGSYYLLIKIDIYNSVNETDEMNNIVMVSPVTVTVADVDWKVSFFEIAKDPYSENTTLNVHGILPVNWSLKNEGTTEATGSLWYSFYLSADQTLSQDDYTLSMPFGFSANETLLSQQFSIPGLPPGTYTIIVKIDSDNDFIESNEDNNIFLSEPIFIAPSDIDIEIVDLGAVTSSYSSVEAYLTVRNNGTTPVGSYSVSMYLSEDNVYDPYFDTRIGSPYMPSYTFSLGAESTQQHYLGHEIYTPIPSGHYYLIVAANEAGHILEANYANNIYISGSPVVYIQPLPVPAVSITSASFNGTNYESDVEYSVHIEFNNSGDADGPGILYSLELKNESDAIVYSGTKYIHPYFSGAEAMDWTFSLDSLIQSGYYKLEISCDDFGSVTSFFSVPLIVKPLEIELSGNILGVDGIVITKGKLFLYYKDENRKVKFIDRKDLTNDNTFEYHLNSKTYTLYFIPDPVLFPDYVPTILGPSVILKPESFFNLTATKNIAFEIFKLGTLASGEMSISGNVFTDGSDSAGRIMEDGEPVAGYPVILLLDGVPVRMTTLDANGFYEFTSLPENIYQLVIAFQPDIVQLDEPIVVDVTEGNVILDLNIKEGQIETRTEIILGTEGMLGRITAFPNPVNEVLQLASKEPIRSIAMTNLIGMEYPLTLTEGNTISFDEVPAGVYLVRVECAGRTHRLKIVKE